VRLVGKAVNLLLEQLNTSKLTKPSIFSAGIEVRAFFEIFRVFKLQQFDRFGQLIKLN
jgi:hypothetical protein